MAFIGDGDWTPGVVSAPAVLAGSLVPLALVLVIAVGVGLAVWVMGRWGARFGNGDAGEIALARRLPVPLGWTAGFVAALVTLNRLQERVDSTLVRQARVLLWAVTIAMAAWALVRAARVGLEKVGQRHKAFQPASRVTSRLVSLLLYAAAFLTILAQYGISITPLLTGLGIAALAVGLALQDTLSNFFASIWIQTEDAIAPGHYVRVEGQNVEGFVERVGWRTTRIRVLAGNVVVIPNAKMAQAIVTDLSLPTPAMNVKMVFQLPFDLDPARAIAILVEEAKAAAKENPGLLEDPAPAANATPGIGEWTIGYSLILKVREVTDQWSVQSAVTRRVWSRLQREGIRIPYPARVTLQAPGEAFAPRPFVQVARSRAVPEEPDPAQREAELTKQSIAAQRAAEAAPPGKP